MDGPRPTIIGQLDDCIEKSRRLAARADSLIAELKCKIAHLDWFIDSVQRFCEPEFFQGLQTAIRAMHGCESRHHATFAVRKVHCESVVWDGMVEEFVLVGHPQAAACYAWYDQTAVTPVTFTLLKEPPIDSPQKAVQLFLSLRAGLPVKSERQPEPSPRRRTLPRLTSS